METFTTWCLCKLIRMVTSFTLFRSLRDPYKPTCTEVEMQSSSSMVSTISAVIPMATIPPFKLCKSPRLHQIMILLYTSISSIMITATIASMNRLFPLKLLCQSKYQRTSQPEWIQHIMFMNFCHSQQFYPKIWLRPTQMTLTWIKFKRQTTSFHMLASLQAASLYLIRWESPAHVPSSRST